MWDYTEKVMDHFRHPRNVGIIEHPDGKATVGSLACGDALTFMFRLGDDGKIVEAKFQTFGCASAVASSSALTEMVLGKTLEEAEKITNREIAEHLGGLPDQKMHCSVMGKEALEAAIHNYRTGEENVITINDEIVCSCFGVSRREIENVVKENHLTSVEEVTNFCKAGGGCGMCRDHIQEIIDEINHINSAAPASDTSKKMTTLQKIKLIEQTLEQQVRPVLKKDGGDVELIDVDGETVRIAFRGMCAGCRSAGLTRDNLIATALHEFVDPALKVEME
ncbi:MAG: Fe-S cluster assembly protein NifU [Kiritimatiellia bacterium]